MDETADAEREERTEAEEEEQGRKILLGNCFS